MASLKNIQIDAKATQHDVSTSGKVGDRSFSVKSKLNANLADGWTARLTLTDKTASALAKNVSVNPAGAVLEVNNGDHVRLTWNAEKQRAAVKVAGTADVAEKSVRYNAEWRQDNNEIDLEASHDLDSSATVTLCYGVHNQALVCKGKYTVDNSSVSPEFNVKTNDWKVTLNHKLTANDKLEAVAAKGKDVTLAYTRTQDGVELTLDAPVRADIAANATIRVQRTFEL